MLKYLIEIRNKFILLTITFFSTLVVCYYYKDALLFLVTQMQLNDENLYFIFTDVTELFSVYFKIVFFFSVHITLWYFFYHIFFFATTALYFYEFKFLNLLWINGTLFWFLSILVTSCIIIPFGWSFFLSYHFQDGFYFEARVSDYFKFYRDVYVVCLIYCQLSVLLFVFLADSQQNYFYIRKYRKIYYYVFLIIATFMTPPDIISQIFTTFFLITVYEVVLVFSIFRCYLKLLNLATS